MIVTGEGATLPVEAAAGAGDAGIGSDTGSLFAESSFSTASAIAAAAATGAADLADSAIRFITGFCTGCFFDGSLTARGATTATATGAALGAGAGEIGCGFGATSTVCSRRSGRSFESAAPGAGGRRGNAIAASMSTTTPARATVRRRVVRPVGASGGGTEVVATARAGSTGDAVGATGVTSGTVAVAEGSTDSGAA